MMLSILAFDEAKKLQEICLEKAQLARELHFKCISKQQKQPLVSTCHMMNHVISCDLVATNKGDS